MGDVSRGLGLTSRTLGSGSLAGRPSPSTRVCVSYKLTPLLQSNAQPPTLATLLPTPRAPRLAADPTDQSSQPLPLLGASSRDHAPPWARCLQGPPGPGSDCPAPEPFGGSSLPHKVPPQGPVLPPPVFWPHSPGRTVPAAEPRGRGRPLSGWRLLDGSPRRTGQEELIPPPGARLTPPEATPALLPCSLPGSVSRSDPGASGLPVAPTCAVPSGVCTLSG